MYKKYKKLDKKSTILGRVGKTFTEPKKEETLLGSLKKMNK